MGKRNPSERRLKPIAQRPPSAATPNPSGWKRFRPLIKVLGLGSIVAVLALFYTYMAGLPSIDYSKLELAQPLSQNGLLLIRGTIRNYGSTTARNYRVRILFMHGPANEKRPKPDFDMELDAYGRRPTKPATYDLGPGQETNFEPNKPYYVVTPEAYDEIINGKKNLFFFTRIDYQDIFYFTHSKTICHSYARLLTAPLALGRCPADE